MKSKKQKRCRHDYKYEDMGAGIVRFCKKCNKKDYTFRSNENEPDFGGI